MRAADVTDTLELALAASGCHSAKVAHKPRLLSDNGSSYVSSDLAEWLKDRGLPHVRGAPCHPQTQGKIERWHQTQRRLWLDRVRLIKSPPRTASIQLCGPSHLLSPEPLSILFWRSEPPTWHR
jgi:transposase InsO family protein